MSNSVPDYNKLIETESYHKLREVIEREVNYFVSPREIGSGKHKTYCAPFTIADWGRVLQVDYSVFKKIPGEKQILKDLKDQWKKEQKEKYGEEWTKKSASKEKYIQLHTRI